MIASTGGRQQSLLISLSKQSAISAKAQQLSETFDAAQRASEQCEDLIVNGDLDRADRKQRIADMMRAALKHAVIAQTQC